MPQNTNDEAVGSDNSSTIHQHQHQHHHHQLRKRRRNGSNVRHHHNHHQQPAFYTNNNHSNNFAFGRTNHINNNYNNNYNQRMVVFIKTVVLLIIVLLGCTIVRMLVIPIITSWLQQQQQQQHPESLNKSNGNSRTHHHHHHRIFDSLPNNDIDLWIDSTNLKMMSDVVSIELDLRHHMEQSSITTTGSTGTTSSVKKTSTKTERIAILRPPSRLGHIIEDFVTKYIHTIRTSSSSTDIDNIDWILVVQPTYYETTTNNVDNHNNNDWMNTGRYTKIIRPIVMPILFEVLDLMIQTTDRNDDNDVVTMMEYITVHDLVTTLRMLIQYHCYVGQFASTTLSSPLSTKNQQQNDLPPQLLSISLHQFMTYPQEINDLLIEFFNLQEQELNPYKKMLNSDSLLMEQYAMTIFQLYDTCTTLLESIRNKYDPESAMLFPTANDGFIDLLNSVIREEVNRGYCNGELSTISSSDSSTTTTTTINKFQFDDGTTATTTSGFFAIPFVSRGTSSSRVIEIIRTILIENDLHNVCTKYPQAHVCRRKL